MAPINFSLPVALALIQALLASSVSGDLRLASTPKTNFKVQNQNGAVAFTSTVAVYMEPSTFGYQGLVNQKNNNYDNFLRSNIDNEQDNRNFQTESGQDMLPFRTLQSATSGQLTTVDPGVKQTVPLRWNNPHSSEMEVNVWLLNNTVVVPVKKPVCSGEGHQDGVLTYTIPKDFNTAISATVPGFNGCQKLGDCTLQVYAHSVEPRTYAIGTPIIITGYQANATKATDSSMIAPATTDPGTDLSRLQNDLCIPMNDTSADITSAQPRWARQVSDVFNHAYQNSDYSPYSGQQQESISKNLQAAAVLRMTSGNRGELGQAALTQDIKNYIAQLNGKVNTVIERYEQAANNIINNVVNNVKTTGTLGNQKLANGFRVLEAGATNANRLQTATYIPSFNVPADKVAAAKATLSGNLKGLISSANVSGIYVAALNEMQTDFAKAALRGIKYQPAMVKNITTTMADVTQFRKVDASGKADGGKYAATIAFKLAGVQYLSALEDGSDSIDPTTSLPTAAGEALAANPDDSAQTDDGSSTGSTSDTPASDSSIVLPTTVTALLLSAVAMLHV